MTWQYIAGFFDADGSVTLVRNKKTETRSVSLYFTNTDAGVLEEIKGFLEKECGAIGYYFYPKKVKEHHLQGIDLRYQRGAALVVAEQLAKHIMHNKKKERLKILFNEYRPLIKKNGKYSKEEREVIETIAQKFLDIKF